MIPRLTKLLIGLVLREILAVSKNQHLDILLRKDVREMEGLVLLGKEIAEINYPEMMEMACQQQVDRV